MRATITERFFKKVKITPSCWIWTAAIRCHGYGSFKNIHNKTVYAHRFSYEIHFGDIPVNMQVLHRCDNPSCVNPDHFFLGTHDDNMKDKVKKNRQGNKYKKCIPHSTSRGGFQVDAKTPKELSTTQEREDDS